MRSRPLLAVLAIVAVILFSLSIYRSSHSPSVSSHPTMSLVHTVLFGFKAGAAPEEVKAICGRFLQLKDQCIHPTTQTPYILSVKGGKDNSPEGMQGGLTHGFVVEFNTMEDRAYYLDTDPAHQKFKESVGPLLEKVVVVDFSDGVY